jgi:hypothetical protein
MNNDIEHTTNPNRGKAIYLKKSVEVDVLSVKKFEGK